MRQDASVSACAELAPAQDDLGASRAPPVTLPLLPTEAIVIGAVGWCYRFPGIRRLLLGPRGVSASSDRVSLAAGAISPTAQTIGPLAFDSFQDRRETACGFEVQRVENRLGVHELLFSAFV